MSEKSGSPISEGLETAFEIHNRITDSVQPILDQQKKIEEITAGINIDPPHLRIENPVMDAIETAHIQSSALQFANRIANFQINTEITRAIQSFIKIVNSSFYENIRTVVDRVGEVLQNIAQSPAIQWLQSIDYNPIIAFFQNLDLDFDISERYKELNEAYLQAMYDCNWFPYAGWTIDIRLFTEVNDILATSRGKSKRRTARIDKAIFSYYTDHEIRKIKRSWNNSDLEFHIKKMIGQAIDAHLRGEYALTITCLATMWEGLIHKRSNVIGRRSSEKTKQDFKELISDNDFEPIFADFYENMIVSQCNTPDDVIEGVPNRNGISHSKYKKYPNKKASLNAILLTDFIINLSPIDVKEDQTKEVKM